MYHQTTVEEQVIDAERDRIRAEIQELHQELRELFIKYPDFGTVPETDLKRSLEIGERLDALAIEIGQCLWCDGSTLPGKGYCLPCSNDQIKIANEVLVQILAEESD